MAEGEAKKDNGYLGWVPTNPLDNFDNVTYNIKLYMIPPVEETTESKSDSTQGDPREDLQGEVTSKGGFLNGAYVAKPENTVVLAQTGVTGVLIDNVEIMNVPGGKGGKITQTITCNIRQPGAANFLDMIVIGRERLNIPHMSVGGDTAPFFFEVNFQGYNPYGADFEPDDGGQIRDVAGPYRFKAFLQNATFELDSTGTNYYLTFAIADDLAYSDAYYKTPTKIITEGETITDHIKEFIKQWNHYLKEHAGTTKDEVDTVNFQLKNLVGEGQTTIKDEKLDKGLDATARENTALNKAGVAPGETEETTQGVDKSVSNVESEKIKIEVPAGSTVETYIGMLLARNLDFTNSITRSKVEKEELVSTDETFISDFKVNALVKQLKYDEKRKGYSKEIIFQPGIFKTPSGKQFATTEELNPSEEEIKKRVNAMEISRAYEYIFTGRNDQVINVDLKYDFGINLLIPPKGGKFGNAVLNNISNFSPDPAEIDSPLSGKTLASLAAKFQNAKKFLNIFKAAKDGSIRDLAKAAGLDENQIKEVIADRVGATAKGLIESLSNRQIGQAVADAILPKDTSTQLGTVTESDRQNLLNNSLENYKPSPSGYIYGGDLTGGQEVYLDALSENDAKSKIQDSIETQKIIATPNVEEKEIQDESYSGGPATRGQNLFGYMYGQKNTADILLRLDMALRGDPWYLGEPDRTGGINYDKIPDMKEEKSSANGLNTYGGDNFILFELRQPMYFDPFINEEDLNEGLYPVGGQSFFITGIYRLLEVVNNFDNGRYTVNVRTAKESTIDLSKLEDKNSLSLDDIRASYEQTFKEKNWQDARNQTSSDYSGERFDDPAYIDNLLNIGSGTGMENSLQDLLDQGLITSEQEQKYKAWKANRTSPTQGKKGDI
jgi:hypothetical protein